MFKFNVSFSLFFICFSLYCQTKQSAENELQKYFSEAALEKTYYLTPAVLNSIKTQYLLKTAQPYLRDVKPFVRYKAIDLVKRKGLSVSDTSERQAVTSLLIEACKDKASGVSGAASKALTSFNLEDFSVHAADSVISLIKLRPFYLERIIKLSGFIQSPATKEYLLRLVNDTSLSKKEVWAVNLALARIGDKNALDHCLSKISAATVNDRAINYLFDDLVYMRQPASISYMLNGILSDEKKCISSNPDSEKSIICAYKIMELVAPVIEGFPVKLTDFGELDIQDYDAALADVRTWITNNKRFNLIKRIY